MLDLELQCSLIRGASSSEVQTLLSSRCLVSPGPPKVAANSKCQVRVPLVPSPSATSRDQFQRARSSGRARQNQKASLKGQAQIKPQVEQRNLCTVLCRVLTTLKNLEISGYLLILENSGKTQEFKIYSGNLSDACCFFMTQSEAHKKMT